MADATAPDELATAPIDRAGAAVAVARPAARDTGKGVADQYLIELVEYPTNSGRGLWLKVNGFWRRLDNPSSEIQATVHAAFCRPEPLKVVVSYRNEVIVGLAVKSNESSRESANKEVK